MEKPKGFFHRIEVGFKQGVKNPFAEGLLHAAKTSGFKLRAVDTIDVYPLGGISGFWNLERVAKQILADPLLQEFAINEPLALHDARNFDFAIEVSFTPGVTDHVGPPTARAVTAAVPSVNGTAFAPRQYLLSGVSKQEAEKIIATLVASDLLEKWETKSKGEFKQSEGFPANPPIAGTEKNSFVEQFSPSSSLSSFEKTGEQRLLALTPSELSAIKKKYSEKIFAQKRRKLGMVAGIVGVNRDILGAGLGARPIFNTDVFCFAPPDYKGVYPRVHPQQVLWGVVRGIQDGGNKSGIPTVNGSITFDDSFAGKPLVYCGTGGIMPARLKDKRATHEKKARAGNLIVMIGGRVGEDGIHRATFSSLGLTQSSPTSAVQIGDPFTQKKAVDFVIEARDAGLIESITDNGAGGLSSSVGEMALQSNGATVHLDRVPLKYPGLAPWEIFVSESQERMTVAIKPENRGRFFELARKHEVESTEIGVFTNTGVMQVLFEGKTAGMLELAFLHNPP